MRNSLLQLLLLLLMISLLMVSDEVMIMIVSMLGAFAEWNY